MAGDNNNYRCDLNARPIKAEIRINSLRAIKCKCCQNTDVCILKVIANPNIVVSSIKNYNINGLCVLIQLSLYNISNLLSNVSDIFIRHTSDE